MDVQDPRIHYSRNYYAGSYALKRTDSKGYRQYGMVRIRPA